jgi:hypothetical protein
VRSEIEEQQAFLEFMANHTVSKSEDAEEDLLNEGHNEADVKKLLDPFPVMKPDPKTTVVCVLYRGTSRMTGNTIGDCDNCGDPIQFRPSVSKGSRKVCVFCCLQEIRRH